MKILYHTGDKPDPEKHNYWHKVEAICREATPGTYTGVRVAHDKWCAIYDGGYCNCDPEVTLENSQ